jgi:hypothetical protein
LTLSDALMHAARTLAIPAGLAAMLAAGAAAQPAADRPPAPPTSTRATKAAADDPAATAATGPVTRPTTGPSSRPATQPAGSLDTPRDALKWFAAALRDGDVGRLRAVVFTAGEAEDHMIASMGEMAQALAGLHKAALSAYGPEAAARFTDDTAAHFDQTVARIDAADVAFDGDSATVRYAEDKDNPFSLRRMKDQWRIPAAQFAGAAPADAVERRAGEMLVQAKIVNEIARDVRVGKYRSADAASLAWRGKMMSALGGGPPPPATQKSP